jgi:hypothetical protein
MRNNLGQIVAICLLPALFYSCEKPLEDKTEEDKENEKVAINLVLTSKNWTVTSYKTNFNEAMALKEIMNGKVSYKMDVSESCEHQEFQTMKTVNINFTSKESETKIRYARSETYTGSCDDNAKSGDLTDTTTTTSSSYILDIDKLKLTANFGSFTEIGAEGDYKMQYDIVTYSKSKVELAGTKTIEGIGLKVQLVLE